MRDSAPSDAILDRILSLHPKIIDLTLDRVWRLLADLGDPQRALPPVVHIAGTNGKGSTLAMIRAGIEAGSPLGRVIPPDDVAAAAAFLASDDAASITGEDLNVTAGRGMF